MFVKLKYGNTNTFFIRGKETGILIDTDFAGTMNAFFREIGKNGVSVVDIEYVLATHYHPDHIGLISELINLGVKLLLLEHQSEYVNLSDNIFYRCPRLHYKSISKENAVKIKCEESRDFLSGLGIQGEILPTKSHSQDGIAVILDDGNCFVGDLEPKEYVAAYENNTDLEEDWKLILSHNPKFIHYGHANCQKL